MKNLLIVQALLVRPLSRKYPIICLLAAGITWKVICQKNQNQIFMENYWRKHHILTRGMMFDLHDHLNPYVSCSSYNYRIPSLSFAFKSVNVHLSTMCPFLPIFLKNQVSAFREHVACVLVIHRFRFKDFSSQDLGFDKIQFSCCKCSFTRHVLGFYYMLSPH